MAFGIFVIVGGIILMCIVLNRIPKSKNKKRLVFNEFNI